MNNNFKITPEGIRDLLFEECTAKNIVGTILKNVFEKKGYNQVITPTLEFFDLFSFDGSGIHQQDMYKLTDNHGRLLAVRADSTLPIARMVSTRLKNENLPIRLYYDQPVYRNISSLTGKSHEVNQAGIELIGVSGKRADLEVLVTAIECMKEISKDFRLEIGNAIFFKVIASELDVSDEIVEELRVSIESKNYSELNYILENLTPSKAVEDMKKLPRLFGGQEVFEEAFEIFKDTKAESALNSLKEIFTSLSTLYPSSNFMIDLGLVQRNDYYSDIIFSAFIENSGDMVLNGGRYDNLFNRFDVSMPAAGFGINVDILSKSLLQKGIVTKNDDKEVLVYGESGFEVKAMKKIEEYEQNSVSCEYSVQESREEAISYAKDNNIKSVCIVSNDVEIIKF